MLPIRPLPDTSPKGHYPQVTEGANDTVPEGAKSLIIRGVRRIGQGAAGCQESVTNPAFQVLLFR